MKTYEDFLIFLEEHLKHITDFVPPSDPDFRPLCFALARFLLSEPYRWETMVGKWPHLPVIEKPSQDELISFFKTHTGLPLSFKKELDNNDVDTLYQAYELMYPIFIVKHDFFTDIFRADIRSRKYKKIFREGNEKIKRIIEKADILKKEKSFIELMQKFTKDLSGFSLTLINNKKLLDQAIDKLAAAN